MQKKIAPGKFDVSVGGHFESGENAEVAGPREVKEELGLTVPFSELVPLGRRVFVYCFTPGIKEYEFQDVFLFPRDVRPEDLSLQEEELDGVVEMDVEEGIALFSGRVSSVALSLLQPDGNRVKVSVRADDFVPCIDNYYLKLLGLSRRYLSGDREALVI